MSFDYSKLEGKIKEYFGTQAIFANNVGLSEKSVSAKLNNKVEWKQLEILRCCELLEIQIDEIPLFFYHLSSST